MSRMTHALDEQPGAKMSSGPRAETAENKQPAKPARGRGTRAELVEAEISTIQDSRGQPTVQVTMRIDDIAAVGEAPVGISTGSDEAHIVPVEEAVDQIKREIVPFVQRSRVDLKQHKGVTELDETLADRAGPRCMDWAANAVLPVSRALWGLAARIRNTELANYLRKNESELCRNSRVDFFLGAVSGGMHAGGADGKDKIGKDYMEFQGVLVIPAEATNYREALQMGDRIEVSLQEVLSKHYDKALVHHGETDGLVVKGLLDNARAISHVIEAVERAYYAPGGDVKLALDVGACAFFNDQRKVYSVAGKDLSTQEMVAYILGLVDKHPGKIAAVIDGLGDNDWGGWSILTEELGKRDILSLGHDLFATQEKRLRRGVNNASAHGIVLNPHQNGTVTGTLQILKLALEHNLKYMFAARSGETNDNSIADLAFATGALGLKAGSCQSEKTTEEGKRLVFRKKYLRMAELEEARWYG